MYRKRKAPSRHDDGELVQSVVSGTLPACHISSGAHSQLKRPRGRPRKYTIEKPVEEHKQKLKELKQEHEQEKYTDFYNLYVANDSLKLATYVF